MTALGDADPTEPISTYLGGSNMTVLGDIPLTDDIEDYAGGGFSGPADIPDLLQWYDADQETGRTNGDVIASITDRSGNGHTLTGSTGPTWRNAANGINGVPAYEFGSNKEVSASGRVVPLTEFSLFFVMSYTSGRPVGLENDTGGTHGLGLYSGGWIVRNNGSSYDIGFTPQSGTYALRMGASGGLETYNTKFHAGTNVSGTQYSDAGVNFTLGSSGNGASDLSGKIAVFLSYSRRLSDEEWFQVIGYLRTKYG